ncbi:MAG: hypothetical protein ABMA13_08805 [Chthoniobacteraceae bacterium]
MILTLTWSTARGGEDKVGTPDLRGAELRQLVLSLPGEVVRSLPGQLVRPLTGQIVHSLPRYEVPMQRGLPAGQAEGALPVAPSPPGNRPLYSIR